MAGAGFLIIKSDSLDSGDPLMLALIDQDGIYDIPKGGCDKGESTLETAKRECFEECSIAIEDSEILFSGAPYYNGLLTVYCAATDKEPLITKNPHTGIHEHVDFEWLTKDKFCTNCLPFLIEPINSFYSEHLCSYNN